MSKAYKAFWGPCIWTESDVAPAQVPVCLFLMKIFCIQSTHRCILFFFFQLPPCLSCSLLEKCNVYQTFYNNVVTRPVNHVYAPLCVPSSRWLCWVSRLWPPAPAQHLPPWPEDLRLWRRQSADDSCCFCKGDAARGNTLPDVKTDVT